LDDVGTVSLEEFDASASAALAAGNALGAKGPVDAMLISFSPVALLVPCV
jgi:hypothetical protein